MNGEAQLSEFISRPCRATMIAFAKSLFTSKDKYTAKRLTKNRRIRAYKELSKRWRLDRCDIFHRGSPFSNCEGCPFRVEQTRPSGWLRRVKVFQCYFVSKFDEIREGMPGLSNNTINQHQFPKELMKDMGFILMGAVQLKNAIELRKEGKT